MRRRLADEITALLVIGGLKLMLHMPDKAVSPIATIIGGLSYRLSSARRNRARMNLQRILSWMAATGTGDASYRAAASDPKALEALVKAAFRHHALYTFEMARAPRFTEEWVLERLEVENRDQVNAWLIPDKALILIGMHLGAIEVPGIFAVHRIGRITSPMETVANARIQRYIYSTRATVGIRIVSLAEAGQLLDALRNNEAIGLVSDRNLTPGGYEVELFGVTTKIPSGPALIAAETGVPVYVSAVRRIGAGRYRGRVRELLMPAGASRRERSRAMAREEARLFEEFIVDAPEQWLALFHPIWPDLELSNMPKNRDAA